MREPPSETAVLLPLALVSLCAQAGDDTALVGVLGPASVPALTAQALALGGLVERCFEASKVCILRFLGTLRPPPRGAAGPAWGALCRAR